MARALKELPRVTRALVAYVGAVNKEFKEKGKTHKQLMAKPLGIAAAAAYSEVEWRGARARGEGLGVSELASGV